MKTSTFDIVIDAPSWTKALRNARAVCRRAGLAALAAAGPKGPVDLSVLLTSDSAVRKLNATYRGKDKATNVLSFPSGGPTGEKLRVLGDIAIAYGLVAREARGENKSLSDHLSHLVVHGVLHLLSYDHEDSEDADNMERLERKILARLGIADPYAAPPAQKRPAPKPRVKRRKQP